jgi:hypothetical protein
MQPQPWKWKGQCCSATFTNVHDLYCLDRLSEIAELIVSVAQINEDEENPDRILPACLWSCMAYYCRLIGLSQGYHFITQDSLDVQRAKLYYGDVDYQKAG